MFLCSETSSLSLSAKTSRILILRVKSLMSDLKGLFGLVTGVNFGPLVSSETCLCAKEKEERLMILAENVEEVLDIPGLGSFLKHCCKVMLESLETLAWC